MESLKYIFGLACRVWDYFFSPRQVAKRKDAEVDKAIATHDEKQVNKILDDSLR